MGRSVGRGIREFKASIGGDDDREHAELVAQSIETAPTSSDAVAGDVVAMPARRA